MISRIRNQAFESPEAVAIALHLEFPAYSVIVRRDGGEPRYQMLAKDDRYPTCLISPDPDEIRSALREPRTTPPPLLPTGSADRHTEHQETNAEIVSGPTHPRRVPFRLWENCRDYRAEYSPQGGDTPQSCRWPFTPEFDVAAIEARLDEEAGR